ncbi:MAG: hypothetical protein JJ879_16075 [Sneathiella sp.]|nr:hypothetical protein [Sneathiella sp.]
MKKILTTAAAFTTIAFVSAHAEGMTFETVDTDKSGAISMQELVTAMPTVTDAQFKGADLDGNGELSKEEFEKATTKK